MFIGRILYIYKLKIHRLLVCTLLYLPRINTWRTISRMADWYPKAYRDIEETFPHSHQDRLVEGYAGKGYKQLLIDNYDAELFR